jgi:hypothetical protein
MAGGDYAELAVFRGQVTKVYLGAHGLVYSHFGLFGVLWLACFKAWFRMSIFTLWID